MTEETLWLVRDRVLLQVLKGKLDTEAYLALDQSLTHGHLKVSKAMPIHMIVDCRELHELPDLIHLRDSEWAQFNRIGWVLLVGVPNAALKFSLSALGQMYQARFRFLNKMDDALSFMQEFDHTLPNLQEALAKRR